MSDVPPRATEGVVIAATAPKLDVLTALLSLTTVVNPEVPCCPPYLNTEKYVQRLILHRKYRLQNDTILAKTRCEIVYVCVCVRACV